jgi:hypothetical protein
MDMNRGVYLNMPEEGGVLDQSPLLMTHIEMAWRVWNIIIAKRAEDHSPSDQEFMRRWVIGD